MKKALRLKRTLRTVLFVLLLSVVGMGKGYAYDFSAVCETGQVLYYNYNSNIYQTVTVTYPGTPTFPWNGFDEPTGDIIIPERVFFYDMYFTVTAIGDHAFDWCTGLTGSLTIPNTVTSIGRNAFTCCSGFTGSLTIPNTVTSIGNGAFAGCSGFTGLLTIPNGLNTINEGVFSGCTGFTGPLVIPNSVTTIGECAFSWDDHGCDAGFTSLKLGDNVETIGYYAFNGFRRMTGILEIPSSVSFIGGMAFGNCTGFSSIISHAETPPLADGAFYGMDTNLQVTVPACFLESYASISWGGLNNFISDGLCTYSIFVSSDPFGAGTVIGGGTYEEQTTCVLKAIANEGYIFTYWLENGVIISENTELSFVVDRNRDLVAHFERNVLEGFDFFEVCPSGQTLYYRIRGGDNHDVEVVAPYKEQFGIVTLWAECQKPTGNVVIPNQVRGYTVTAIGQCEVGDRGGAFEGCSELTSITIPRSINGIGNNAFKGCRGLETMYYNAENCIIFSNYDYWLSDCNLHTLFIGNTVEAIPIRAFANCNGITSLTIPNSVKTIGNRAFSNCDGLTSLTIPNSVESIGTEAFCDCDGLVTVIIGESIKSIGSGAFDHCSRMNMLQYNAKGRVSVYGRVFSDCSNLTTIHIGPNVEEIDSYVFKGCNTVHFIVALGPIPAVLDAGAFSDIVDNSMLMVSCGKKVTYYSVWNMFPYNNIIEDCGEYSISMNNNGVSGGSVVPSTQNAKMGDAVTLLVTPNLGMHLESLVVCNASDPSQIIPVSMVGKATSTYSFTMPPFEVVVMAAFATGTSVDEINGSVPVAIYPNPTKGLVKIESESLKSVGVFNLIGQQIFSGPVNGDEFEFDFSHHDASVYLIRIETENGVATKRVVLTK